MTPGGDGADGHAATHVLDLASDWLRQNVRTRLRSLGVTTSQLASATETSESAWRNKLNGNRTLQIGDLLAIVMAFDVDLFTQPPFDSTDLDGYFPPPVRPRLSHSALGDHMPTLRDHGTWPDVARAVRDWYRGEQDAGRAWLVGANDLARSVLTHAADTGTASSAATPADASETGLDLEWVATDTLVRVTAPSLPDRSTGAPASAARVRATMTQFAVDVTTLAEAPNSTKMLLVLTSPPAADAIGDVLAFAQDAAASHVVSLKHLHRLGHPDPGSLTRDLDVEVLLHDPRLGLLCIRVK